MRLWGVDPEEDRFRIRALRATPPGRASSDDRRRRVFTAALGQFDELLNAAAAVGPASRPLPLYYALSQAGRAIAAARQQTDREWEPRSHGLTIGDPEPDSIALTTITPDKRKKNQQSPTDGFGIVADSTFASDLTAPTCIANIWAAIPGLDSRGLGAGCPRAMHLELDVSAPLAVSGTLRSQVGLPGGEAGQAQLTAMVERYYPAISPGLVVLQVARERAPFDGMQVQLAWRSDDGVPRDARTVAVNYLGSYWLLPALNPNGDTLKPLLLWWCLLYALSDLARYHPSDWTALLAPDESPRAVPIERALATALAVLPRLVLTELVPGAYADEPLVDSLSHPG